MSNYYKKSFFALLVFANTAAIADNLSSIITDTQTPSTNSIFLSDNLIVAGGGNFGFGSHEADRTALKRRAARSAVTPTPATVATPATAVSASPAAATPEDTSPDTTTADASTTAEPATPVAATEEIKADTATAQTAMPGDAPVTASTDVSQAPATQ